MAKRILIFISLLLLIFSQNMVWGQTAYQQGWDLFLKNDRAEARKSFNTATQDPATAAESFLCLSLIDWNENRLDDAFGNFKKFYAASSNPYPYLYAMSGLPFMFEHNSPVSADKLAFFQKIITDPNMNGTLKAMLNGQIGGHYEATNNLKKANAYYAKIGSIDKWQVLGSFDNTSGSGFSKDWGAVEKAGSQDIFKNSVNADVHWYTAEHNKANKWFYFDYYFSYHNSVMYAQTFVTSAVEQEAYLRAGTSGSLKVWVNDVLVSSVPEERNCDLDIYAYQVKLNKGANRILVQIGQSEIDRANFLVRLTDKDANPLPNITVSAEYATYEKSTEKPACQLLPFFAEQYFSEKIKSAPGNPLYSILLAQAYLRNDKSYEGTKCLKTLESTAGNSTLISFLLYEAYMRAQNQTDCEKEMETIKNSDPNSYFALQTKYQEAIKSEKYTEAERICKQVKELYGETESTDEWDLNLASLQKRYDEVITQAFVLNKKYPANAEYANLAYVIWKDVKKSPYAALKTLEKYCSKYENSQMTNMLAGAYFDNGLATKGLSTLNNQLKKYPYASGYYENLINILFEMRLYSDALALTDKGNKLTPFEPNMYTLRGYIYKNMNNTEKARENFRKAIYLSPTSYDARTQLRLLEDKKEVFELFPKNDLKEIIAKGHTSKDYPDDNSIILMNEIQQVVYPEGAKEFRKELAVKILKQSGIERWKEYGIGYNGYIQKLIVDKAEVIKSNGSVVKAETNNNNRVVFTNLEVNDVLHLEYRIQDLSTGKLASQFSDRFMFQYSIPAVHSRYSLMVPADRKFDYTMANGTVEPEITTVEDMKLYKWELNDQPAVKEENYMSAYIDQVPTLFYSSMPDWKYVSDWYRDLTTSKFNPDFVLKETLDGLLKDKESLGKMEKARLFYNYILENFTYSSVDFLQSNYIPQKASRTITTRLGDCKDLSTLFVALCRESGIDANLVLISTRDRGNNILRLPSIWFNHCIAQLNIDGKKYYLELTDNNLPFGSALKSDLNSNILPIPYANEQMGDKLLTMDMPERTLNSSVRNHTISFVKNDMNIDRSYLYYGAMTSYQRRYYKNVGPEEQMKKKSESEAKAFNGQTKLTSLSFTELDNLSDSVAMNFRLEVKNAVQDVAGMKIFRLPWSDTNSLDIVSAETRKYPFEFWSYQTEDKTTEIITIDLPQGKKLAEVPQNQKFECPSATYSLTFDTRTPGKVLVTRHFERKKDQVSTGDYPAFREFMSNVCEWDSKQYALK